MKTLESLRTGKSICGDEEDESQWKQREVPPWFDQDKFDRGIAFFRQHMSSILFSYMLSLIAGFNLDVFLQTLLFTGQSSTPEVSGKRYFATLLYILQWYDTNISCSESRGYKSLLKVRRIHQHVRRAMTKRQKQILLDIVDHENNDFDAVGLLEAEGKRQKRGENAKDEIEKSSQNDDDDDVDDFVYIDLQRPTEGGSTVDGGGVNYRLRESMRNSKSSHDEANSSDDLGDNDVEVEEKLYLSQYDMALVQVAFVAGVALYPEWIGINDHKRAFEDYIFTWRVFGWFLGIHDRFNICEGSFEDVRSISAEVRDYELIPSIERQAPEADAVVRAFIQGAHDKFRRQDASLSTFLSPAALISFSRRPFRMAKKFEPRDLTYFDQFCLVGLQLFFTVTYYVPPFRNLVNSVLSLPNVMRLIA